jgi:DNA-binding ferritin-like protein
MKREVIEVLLRAKRPDLANVVAHTAVAAVNTEPLVKLLVFERALFSYHQAAHWRSSGAQYYGDHLLFQRLYEAIADEIDSLGERIMGLGGAIEVAAQTHAAGKLLDQWRGELTAQAQACEQQFLALIGSTMQGQWSDGVQNLLQGIADQHETHVYLLGRRNR